MSFKHMLAGFVLIFLLSPHQAQEAFREYQWERAEFTLQIPATWDEPIFTSSEDRNTETLLIVQDFAENPASRPPAVPFLMLTLLRQRSGELPPYEQLAQALREINIEPIGELPANLMNTPAQGTIGSSSDGTLTGIGRVVTLPDGGTLILTGRSARTQYAAFEAIYSAVASSILQGLNQVSSTPVPGILWQKLTDPADGQFMLLDPTAILSASDELLYVADRTSGILIHNATTGVILGGYLVDLPFEPTSLALSADQILHVADLACSCIRRFAAGEELEPIGDFAEGSPQSIAIAADGTLYASDQQDFIPVVRMINGNTEQPLSDPALTDQPLLLTDRAGQILIITRDGTVFAPQSAGLLQRFQLEVTSLIEDVAIDAANHLLVLSSLEGVQTFDLNGQFLNQFTLPDGANPARIMSGLAANTDGTIFITSSDGVSGQITALRSGVEIDRIGATHLTAGSEVQGTFRNPTAAERHTWTFDGSRGDSVVLTALANLESPALDTALRLLAPDGSEIAYADQDESGTRINPADPQIIVPNLPDDGIYVVLVEQQFGEGSYTLGYTSSQSITLETGSNILSGILRGATPIQSYHFEARAGQVLVITMRSQAGTLDPILRLWNPSGELLAENDDALDSSFGRDAQIESVRLDRGGIFRLDAGRFDGEGAYQIEIFVQQ